jgi:hypothetical protein
MTGTWSNLIREPALDKRNVPYAAIPTSGKSEPTATSSVAAEARIRAGVWEAAAAAVGCLAELMRAALPLRFCPAACASGACPPQKRRISLT